MRQRPRQGLTNAERPTGCARFQKRFSNIKALLQKALWSGSYVGAGAPFPSNARLDVELT